MIPSIEPSKELIAAVLDVKKVFGVSVEEDDTLYIWSTADEQEQNINIHMFANMCKVWALTQNYWLDSGIQVKPKGWQANCGYLDLNSQIAKDFYANTEPAVIFKAAEWFLEQGKQ